MKEDFRLESPGIQSETVKKSQFETRQYSYDSDSDNSQDKPIDKMDEMIRLLNDQIENVQNVESNRVKQIDYIEVSLVFICVLKFILNPYKLLLMHNCKYR
jgi:hypothetical protein